MPKLQLTLKATQFITDEEDIDAPAPARTLVVDQKVFDSAVSLASAHGFLNSGRQLFCRHLPPAQVNSLVRCVRRALSAKTEVSGVQGRNRKIGDSHLRAFFDARGNHRQLLQIISLLEQGGELTVEAL